MTKRVRERGKGEGKRGEREGGRNKRNSRRGSNDYTSKFLPFHSLLITSEGHIKLTDFGLSKIGLVNCKFLLISSLYTLLALCTS